MKIDKRKQKIEFGPFDMNFLAEFGVERATDMVFDYKYVIIEEYKEIQSCLNVNVK